MAENRLQPSSLNKKLLSQNISKINQIHSNFQCVIDDYVHLLPKRTEEINNVLFNMYKTQNLEVKEKLRLTKDTLENVKGLRHFDGEIITLNKNMTLFMRRARDLVESCTFKNLQIQELKQHINTLENEIQNLKTQLINLDQQISNLECISGIDIKIGPCKKKVMKTKKKVVLDANYNPSVFNFTKVLLAKTTDKIVIARNLGNYFKAIQIRDQQQIQKLQKQIMGTGSKSSYAIKEKMNNEFKNNLVNILVEAINKVKGKIVKRNSSLNKTQSANKLSNLSLFQHKIEQMKKINLSQFTSFDKRRVFREFISHPKVSSLLFKIANDKDNQRREKNKCSLEKKSNMSKTRALLSDYQVMYLKHYPTISRTFNSMNNNFTFASIKSKAIEDWKKTKKWEKSPVNTRHLRNCKSNICMYSKYLNHSFQ